MLKVYHKIIRTAETAHGDIVESAKIINKRSAGSSKLRVLLKYGSYLDIWFSLSGKYSFHRDSALNAEKYTGMTTPPTSQK